jgi:hypothetical protein
LSGALLQLQCSGDDLSGLQPANLSIKKVSLIDWLVAFDKVCLSFVHESVVCVPDRPCGNLSCEHGSQ